MSEEDRENNNFAYMLMKRFFYTYTVIAIIIVLASAGLKIDAYVNNDLSNWTTFVFEIGLGAYIALSILAYENFQRKKHQKINQEKRGYVIKKLELLITLAKEQSEKSDYKRLEDTFDKIIVTLTVFSDALSAIELQQILELSEIGKWACKNEGSFSIFSSETLPFTTSIPANMAAFFGKFDDVLVIIQNANHEFKNIKSTTPKNSIMGENSEKKSNITNNENKKSSFVTLCLIVFVVVLCGTQVYHVYNESIREFSIPLNKLLAFFDLTGEFTVYEDGEIVNQGTIKKKLPATIDVKLRTTALSAQNPIFVSADIIFEEDVPDKIWEDDFDDYILMMFPGAYLFEKDGSIIGESDAVLKLNKMPTDPQRGYDLYRGYQTIAYPFQGEYGFNLPNPENARSIEKIDMGDGTVELHVKLVQSEIFTNSTFYVDSSVASTNLKINYFAQMLTWIVIGIGIFQLRKQFIKGVLWISKQNFRK